ncbi:hypothetical protein MD484_g8420, partial [Candolleomyces efflorescens]
MGRQHPFQYIAHRSHPFPTPPYTMPKEPSPSTPLRRSARQRGTPPGTPDSVSSPRTTTATTPTRHSPVPSSSTSTPSQGLSGLDKPPVIRTYARSGRYGVNLKRELSVISISSTESEALPTAAEALNLKAAVPSNSSTRTLDEIRRCLVEAGTCGICGLFMRKPYITQCGHSWCSGCLRQYFRTKLAGRIHRYASLDHTGIRYNHGVSECTTVPEDSIEQQLLINALRQHHCNLRHLSHLDMGTS